MNTLLDNEWIHVEIVPAERKIMGEWKDAGRKVISEEEFQAIFNRVLEAIKDFQVEKWPDDTTYMGIVPVGCQRWMTGHFFPKAIAHGLKKASVIHSKDIFAVSAVKSVLTKISSDLEVEAFASKEKAEDWMATA